MQKQVSETVLIVEPNGEAADRFFRNMKTVAEGKGVVLEAIIVATPADGLQRLKTHRFHAVVMNGALYPTVQAARAEMEQKISGATR